MVEVAIVGGGIAGLSAAWALAKRKVGFVLFEAAPRWGGVIRTEQEGGFLLEAGPDSILAQKSEGIALCRELGLGDRLVPTNPASRSVFVLHHRRLHPLPEGMILAVPTRIGPMLTTRLFSWPGKLRMALDLVIPARKPGADESIASFLRRRFGEEAVARLGEPLLERVRALLARHALSRPLAHTEITLCQIAGNPVSLGAATFALEGYLSAIGTGGALRGAVPALGMPSLPGRRPAP